jgi:DtxR family transcriptional regulator, Mn-dependent transcriptional regulator
VTPLIDATEMYLRTVWELHEEGIPPLRARLVERLGVSAPAVSETVARLQDDGLVVLDAGRQVHLTERGARLAASVMRKHRLAERLLTDVLGLDLEHAHNEACRWEHVISDLVEQRLVEVLGDPDTSPYGNPIPSGDEAETWSGLVTARDAAVEQLTGTVARMSERLQVDVARVRELREHGVVPGATARCALVEGGVRLEVDGGSVRLPAAAADLVWIKAG